MIIYCHYCGCVFDGTVNSRWCCNACKQAAYRRRIKNGLKHDFVSRGPFKKNKRGYLYLFQRLDGLYKIGVTQSKFISYRLVEVALEVKQKTWIIDSMIADNIYEIEAIIHGEYADKRVVGEWFELNADDIHSIQNKMRLPI